MTDNLYSLDLALLLIGTCASERTVSPVRSQSNTLIKDSHNVVHT